MSPYPLLQSQWLLSLINLLSTRHFSVFPGGWVIKNLPAMQETRVRSLGQDDPMEEDMATHSSILAWENPMDRGAWWATVHGVAKSWAQLRTKQQRDTLTCDSLDTYGLPLQVGWGKLPDNAHVYPIWRHTHTQWGRRPRGRGYMYTYSWFTSLYSRN